MSRTFYNITYKGKKYKAIPNTTGICEGCSFFFTDADAACPAHGQYGKKHACMPNSRPDGSYIIWIEVTQ